MPKTVGECLAGTGLSDAEIAKRTNSGVVTIWRYRTGRSFPTANKMPLLRSLPGVDADELNEAVAHARVNAGIGVEEVACKRCGSAFTRPTTQTTHVFCSRACAAGARIAARRAQGANEGDSL